MLEEYKPFFQTPQRVRQRLDSRHHGRYRLFERPAKETFSFACLQNFFSVNKHIDRVILRFHKVSINFNGLTTYVEGIQDTQHLKYIILL